MILVPISFCLKAEGDIVGLGTCALYKEEQNSKSSALTYVVITFLILLKSALLRGSLSPHMPGHHIRIMKSCQAYFLSTSPAAWQHTLTFSHLDHDNNLLALLPTIFLIAIRGLSIYKNCSKSSRGYPLFVVVSCKVLGGGAWSTAQGVHKIVPHARKRESNASICIIHFLLKI